jgi:hypothetical protein
MRAAMLLLTITFLIPQRLHAQWQKCAGFMHFGENKGVSLLSRATLPAFDVGGTFEKYWGPVMLRVGLSELIVRYGNAVVNPGLSLTSPQPPSGPLGTRASPMVGLGFAILGATAPGDLRRRPGAVTTTMMLEFLAS